MKAFAYDIKASGNLELQITGVIGEGWGEECCTAQMVRSVLAGNPNAKEISANIDTDGGDMFEGMAIYQMLDEHPATVNVSVGARAASCGSLIAMAGDTISMHETSKMLVHNPWGLTVGDAAKHDKRAADLRNLEDSMVSAYASRTGMDPAAVRSLMAEDRLMSAQEAKELGFCTVIRKPGKRDSSRGETEIRTSIEHMRTKALASAVSLQIAAMAPPSPRGAPTGVPTIQPITPPVGSTETTDMDPKLILAALGLPEGATEAQVLNSINGLKASADAGTKALSLLGAKSFDEAQGTIAALNSAKEQGAKDAAELKGMREKIEQSERDSIVAKLEADQKLSPAQKKDLLPTLSLAGLKAFAATAPVLFAGDGKTEPRTESNANAGSTQVLQHNGKTYAQMSNAERAELRKENSELFNTMRQQAIDTGAI